MSRSHPTWSFVRVIMGVGFGASRPVRAAELSACYWFGELTFIGTSLERETRRFLPFAGSALAVVLPCLICRHRLLPLRLADVADRAEYPAAHITLVSHPDDVECRAGFYSADPDRRRAAAECRHGFAAKSRPVPDAPDPRSGPDCGGFHAHDRDPEHRLGNVASAGRRDRGPLRAAHHAGGGDRNLYRRTRGDGSCGGRDSAGRFGCADRDRTVVHSLIAGVSGLRSGSAGAEPQQDTRG